MLLREVSGRGLYNIINYLPTNARMIKAGIMIDNPEMDRVAGIIKRMEVLQTKISKIKVTEPDDSIPVLEEYLSLSVELRDYFK